MHFLALQMFWLLSKVGRFSPKLLVTLVSPEPVGTANLAISDPGIGVLHVRAPSGTICSLVPLEDIGNIDNSKNNQALAAQSLSLVSDNDLDISWIFFPMKCSLPYQGTLSFKALVTRPLHPSFQG